MTAEDCFNVYYVHDNSLTSILKMTALVFLAIPNQYLASGEARWSILMNKIRVFLLNKTF